MRHFGFTGTSQGMRPAQAATVERLLTALGVEVLHLGDCVGADAQAHAMAVAAGIRTVGHPPDKDRRRAFCTYDEERDPRPYLDRNTDIAAGGRDGLIAAPPNFSETKRRGPGAGTWSTVRRGRLHGRTIYKVFPDGKLEVEDGTDE